MRKYLLNHLLLDFTNTKYIQNKTKTRIKLAYGYNYLFYNSFYKAHDKLWQKEKIIANGIRYEPNRYYIPNYYQNIITFLKKKKIMSITQQINQISVIYYKNLYENENIFESIDPHNEKEKFNYVCAIYMGKSSILSMGLKWNKVEGEYCVYLPTDSCAVFDSMFYIYSKYKYEKFMQ